MTDCLKYRKNLHKYIVMVRSISSGKYEKLFYSDEMPEGAKCERIDYQQILELYKSICVDLSKPRALTDGRKTAIRNTRNQLKKLGVTFEEYFRKVQESDFLCRMAGRGTWKADIGFLMKPKTAVQVLEGKYDNRQPVSNNRIAGTPSYDIEVIQQNAMNNTTIRGI